LVYVHRLKADTEFADVVKVFGFGAAFNRADGADMIFREWHAEMGNFQVVRKKAKRDVTRELVARLGFFRVLQELENKVRALGVAVGKIAPVEADLGSVFDGVFR
jgi:hypothetical protein